MKKIVKRIIKMKEKGILVKKIRSTSENSLKAGVIWFKVIAAVNDIKLAKREVELLSFINTRGTISSTSSKEEFCRIFKSSPATISNMVSKLTKRKLLVKEGSKTKINESLRIDFDRDLVTALFINVNKAD